MHKMQRQNLFGAKASASKLPVKSGRDSNYRRSRSLSRIPHPGKSSLPYAGEGSATRPSHSSRSVSQTPRLLGVPGSAYSARSRSTDGKVKRKDPRPITDKGWQAKQFAKTQKYLQDIGASELLNNNTNLRPLTLNMFVQIISFLLESIMVTETLTSKNYVEKLPGILNTLKYPGVVSASVLRTANTMHSWPTILAILSWLVDVHSWVCGNCEDLDDSTEFNDNKTVEEEIQDVKLKAVFKAYTAFNNGQPYNDIAEKWAANEFARILKLPDNVDEFITKTKQTCEQNLKKQEDIIREDEPEMEALEKENEEKNRIMEKEAKKLHEKELKLQKIKDDIEVKTDYIKKAVLEKHMELKKQESRKSKVTATMHANLKEKIIHMRALKKSKQDTFEHKAKISDEIDLRVTELNATLRDKIKQHNLALIQPSLTYPELEQLIIPETSVMRSDMVQILAENSQKKKELLKNRQKLDEKVKEELKASNEQLRKVNTKLEKVTKDLEKKKNIKAAKELKLQQLQQYIDKETEMFLDKISKEKEKNQEILNSTPDPTESRKKLEILTTKFAEWEVKFPVLVQSMLKFFEDLQKHNYEQLPVFDRLMSEFTEKWAKAYEKIMIEN